MRLMQVMKVVQECVRKKKEVQKRVASEKAKANSARQKKIQLNQPHL